MIIFHRLRKKARAGGSIIAVLLTGVSGIQAASAACPDPVPNNGSCVIGARETVNRQVTGARNVRITNKGKISTSGWNVNGLRVRSDSVVINEGLIFADGDLADGVEALGSRITVINKGIIFTKNNIHNNGGDGIDATHDNLTVVNSGSIVASGADSQAIRARGNNTRIVNSGIAAAYGARGHAISTRNQAFITNSGAIMAFGDGADAIRAGSESRIVNTGVISSSNGRAINFEGSNGGSTVVNAGRIISARQEAIVFSGSGNTLVLKPGSLVQGLVRVGEGTDIRIETKTNTVMTVDDINKATFSSITPLIYDRRNNRVIGIAINDIDTASTFAPFLATQIASTATGIMASGGVRINPVADLYDGSELSAGGVDFFMSGFGGVNQLPGRGHVDDIEHRLGGGLAGLQWRSEEFVIGLFGGGGHGRSYVNAPGLASAGRTKSDFYFGGLHAGLRSGSLHLTGVFTGGVMKNHSRRQMLDNMAPGGLANIRGKYDSLFFAGHVGLGWDVAEFKGYVLQPGLTARMTWVRNDAYRETGSTAAYAVDRHEALAWGGRAQLALYKNVDLENGLLRVSSRVGVDFSRFDNDTPNATIAGVNAPLTAPVKRHVLMGFAGIGAALSIAPGNRLTFDMEAAFGGKDTAALTGKIGYTIGF